MISYFSFVQFVRCILANLSRAPAGVGSTKNDLRSGFLVFLIALPLCLGISIASGFPPVAGILSAIIGGVLVSFLGSARLTIKGPAAGLIVIAVGAVQELGQGDPVLGYRRALAVGVLAALVQIALALLRAATMGTVMSPSVVHGMLAAIGVIIMSKQVHTVLGVVPEAREPIELLLEIPHSISRANPEVSLLGAAGLVLLFIWPNLRFKWAKVVPAPLVVLAITVPMGLYFHVSQAHDYQFMGHHYHLGPEYLVRLPSSLLSAVVFPDFSVVWSGTSLKYVMMFALVGTIESTLSVIAVDSMDPNKSVSDLNRDLRAAGIGNLVSALIGGLPMISEIVRSKANLDSGAKSHYANFYHGLFLLVFVALIPGALQEIPLAALAAMLVYTGARLASPAEFLHAKKVGLDQLLLFVTTLVLTLATDLLVGVAGGMALKFVLHWSRGVSPRSFFSPKISTCREGDVFVVKVNNAAILTNVLTLRRSLEAVDDSIREVRVEFENVALVDHTFLLRLQAISQEWTRAKLTLVGLENMQALSNHEYAARKSVQ